MQNEPEFRSPYWNSVGIGMTLRPQYGVNILGLGRFPSSLCTKPVKLHHLYERLLERGLHPPPGGKDAAQIVYYIFLLLGVDKQQ
jgi:hypothetical protein